MPAHSDYSFLRPLLRGLPIIIATMAAGVLAAKKYLLYTTPMYESTAKIKLADIHEGFANSNLYKDFDVFVNTNKIGAEVELLKSKVLVEKVVRKLGSRAGISIYRVGEINKTELYNDSPFLLEAEILQEQCRNKPFSITITNDSLINVQTPNGEKLKGKFDEVIAGKSAILLFRKNAALLQARPGLQVSDCYEAIVYAPDVLVNKIIGGLDIMAVDKDIPVLRISYTSPVPQKSADIVNTLSAAYITDYIDQRFKSADTTADFLNRELKTYSAKLAASEDAIEQYRDSRNIINIRQETETDLRKIADLKKQKASLEMNLMAIDSLHRYIQAGKGRFLELAPNFEAFTDLLSTELVKKTKELQREKQDLLLRYTAENEKVKVVDEKIADINKYFIESIGNTRKSLQTQYANLEKTISDAESVFVGLPSREKKLAILERNFGLNEQIYRFLREKRTEAEIAKAASISFHRIISEGEVPVKPVSPNTPIIKIMAAILGMLSGVGFVYGVHALKARVNNEDTICRLSSTPLAAQLPYCKNSDQQHSAFRKCSLELELKGCLAKGSVIVLSSFDDEEGKEFMAQGLMRSMRALNKNVLLVHAPEAVAGELQLPAAWQKHIAGLRGQYDVIVVNNFSIAKHSSALMLMTGATLNLLLLDSRRTRQKRIEEADLLQQEFSLPNLQFVLNRAGYTPSLFTQAKDLFNTIRKKIRR